MGPVNSLGELVQERPGLTTEKYKSFADCGPAMGPMHGSAADSGDCARFWQLDFGPLGEGFNTQLVTPHRCFNIVAEYITFVCTGIRLNFPVYFYLLIVVLRTT